MLLCAIPTMADAWMLSTLAKSAGGSISSSVKSGQVSTDGLLSKTGFTVSERVSFAADSGNFIYTIVKSINPDTLPEKTVVYINAAANFPIGAPPPPYIDIIPANVAKDEVRIEVTFRKDDSAAINKATATVGSGGTVIPSTTNFITYTAGGLQKLSEPLVFKFVPGLGNKVDSVTATSGISAAQLQLWTTPPDGAAGAAKANQVVVVTIPAGTVITTSIALAGTFKEKVVKIAYAGPQQSIVAKVLPASIRLAGSSRGAAGIFTKWSSVSRPASAAFIPTTYDSIIRTVSGTAYGTYVFLYRIDEPVTGQQVASVTAVTVVTDPKTAVTKCNTCHNATGIGAGVDAAWEGSKHATTITSAPVLCASCHIGVESGGHPGNFTQANACNVCHQGGAPTNHPVAITNTCVYCHNPHSLAANGGCNVCHGYPPSVLTIQLSGHTGLHTSAENCASCHGENAGTNSNHRNGTVDVVITMADGAPHFNNITGGIYPASYNTSKQDCSSCHAAGASNQANRQQWAATGHASIASPAWTSEDFKTLNGCVRCHTTTGFIAYSTARMTAAWGTASDKTKEVLTCVGCHSDLSAGTVRTVPPIKPFADETGYTNHNVSVSNICMNCHSGSNNGASIEALPGAAFTNTSYVAPHFLTAGGSLQGKSGYHFPGRSYADYSSNSHRKVGMANNNATGTNGPCVTCHMSAPDTHSFSPVTIDTTTKAITAITTSICSNCHKPALPAVTLDNKQVEFNSALDVLKAALQDKGFTYSPTAPYFAAKNWGSGQNGANVMGAAFNYKLFASEPGAYVHNPTYAKQLITDSLEAVFTGGSVTGVDVSSYLNSLQGSGLITTDQITSLTAYKNLESSCNGCHGNPPATPAHVTGAVVPGTCVNCHTYSGPGGVTHNNGDVDLNMSCNSCHGDPPATNFHTDHLAGTRNISSAIACLECHNVPATVSAAGHNDGTKQVAFNGPLAKANGATATTCATTWCHGGNTVLIPQNYPARTAPEWFIRYPDTPSTIGTGGPAGTSGSGYCAQCHGYPPLTTSHTDKTATTCIGCHPHINSDGLTFSDKTKHIDGIIDATGGHAFPYSGSLHRTAAGTTPWSSCTVCHTNAAGSYPVAPGTAPNCQACHIGGLKVPSGTSSCYDCHGATATNGLPNGTVFPNNDRSHSAHVSIAGTACIICHTGGGTTTATHGSSNGTAATQASVRVVFSSVAGPSAVWTPGTITCATTYCHGQGAPAWGATLWSATDQCGKCHSSTAAGAVSTGVPFYNTAYPTKISASTDARVGAHTAHLTAADALTNASVCADCHGTVTLTGATHMNGATNFTWSALATKGGTLTPLYASGTCANVYCHGASMPGGDTTGTRRVPTWNSAFLSSATLSRAACSSCHGFPPSTASGHPAVTVPATWPAAGAATGALGTTCSCHTNIRTTGTSFADIFVNKALHINGTLDVSGGHAIPYDTHNSDIIAAGGNTACLGCHAMGTSASAYPAAGGAAPNCMSCHKKAAPLHTGTTAGANCSSCHGTGTAAAVGTKGIPTGTAFPDLTKGHSRGAHKVVCTTCHVLGTSGGTGSGVNHGRGSTAGPVRDGKPNVVGPSFVTGITVTGGGVKGTSPTSVTCDHNLISGSGCSGHGTKTW